MSEGDIEQAIHDLQGQEEESLPAAAYRAFTDLTLEPAVVKFEPDLLGFGYEGRDTNMYADVDTQTVSQELLGETVELRAAPQEFHWDYGDGATRTTYEPGEPLPDYDGTGQKIVKTDFETVTSHVYEETGIYPVTVETVYTGQFRVGDGGWRDIPGTVAVESSPGEADIWTQNSRWVSGACESTEQWGCNGPIEFDPATDRPPKIYQDQYDENGRWLGPVE
ncbi:hypothetical protein [Nesterenkonia sp. F]|uniref:hypothetical protein n=1 Tax=Nesterenkonia sp. F TaxID=795955 RepID=UPI000255C92F|nr:hypothetical protein [Nesterenkonia sp. F]